MESLRLGIPPDGSICHFTVGRKNEIDALTERLKQREPGALLLKANYGAGKSHLLKFIREYALEKNWVVSLITLDAKSAVRFNRMDQIVGAVCRNISVPGSSRNGIRQFFNSAIRQIEYKKHNPAAWDQITAGTKWTQSHYFRSDAFYIALRAWARGDDYTCDQVEDWLQNPDDNDNRRPTFLYKMLIEGLRTRFRDPKPKEFYTSSDILVFRKSDQVCWQFLADLDRFARAMGYEGLVLGFDEFEDVIYNLQDIRYQKAAFWNLFEFFSGAKFPAQSYFAVTPGFVAKCKTLLFHKGEFDYDYSQFDALPTFEMSPITRRELNTLARRIIQAHQAAYDWNDNDGVEESVYEIVRIESSYPVENRVRQCIKAIVKHLDDRLEDGV